MSAGNFGEGIPLPLTVDLSNVRAGFAQLLTEYQALRAQISGNPLSPGGGGGGGPPVSFGSPPELRAGGASGDPSQWRMFDYTERDYSGDLPRSNAEGGAAFRSGLAGGGGPLDRDTAASSLFGDSGGGSSMLLRMGSRLAVAFAAREAFHIADAYSSEQHDLAMAGSDSRLQLKAIQSWNNSVSLFGAPGETLAAHVQGAFLGRNVSTLGTDLINQSADIQEERTQTMQREAAIRQRERDDLATYSTVDPVERRRIESRGRFTSDLQDIEQRKQARAELDNKYLANEGEQIREKFREDYERAHPGIAGAIMSHLLAHAPGMDAIIKTKTADDEHQFAASRDKWASDATGLAKSLEIAREYDINRVEANRDLASNLRLEGRQRQLRDDMAHPRNPMFGDIDATLTSGEGEILGFMQDSKFVQAGKARDNLVLEIKAKEKQYLTSFRTEAVNSGYGQLGELFSPATAESPAAVLKAFKNAQTEAAGYNPAVNQGGAGGMKLAPETIADLARQMAEALSSLIPP